MKKTEEKFVITLIFLQLLSAYPYVFERFIPQFDMRYVSVAITAILLVYVLTRMHKSIVPQMLIVCGLIQIAVWIFYYLIHEDVAYFTRVFFIISSLISLSALSISRNIQKYTWFNNNWLCGQAVAGIIAFILVAVGLLYPFYEFENVDGRPAYFFGLTCTNAYIGGIIRSAGFFDEPGALAFWGMYALVFNQVLFKNKRIEWLLIIGLLSTLSMMYFVQLAMYFLFFKVRKLKVVIPTGFLLLIGLLYIQANPHSEIYNLTFHRVEAAQHGYTNRDLMLDEAKNYFYKNPVFGVGASASSKLDPISDNPYENLATDGIVGSLCIYLPLILVIFRSFKAKESKDFLFGALVLMTGYSVRPVHVAFIQYFMLYLYLLLYLKHKVFNQNISPWIQKRTL